MLALWKTLDFFGENSGETLGKLKENLYINTTKVSPIFFFFFFCHKFSTASSSKQSLKRGKQSFSTISTAPTLL